MSLRLRPSVLGVEGKRGRASAVSGVVRIEAGAD